VLKEGLPATGHPALPSVALALHSSPRTRWRRPSWALVGLTSAAAAVVAAWLASQPLRREMSGLRTELKTVEETMERLRLENDALRAAAGTAPGTAAGQFSLRDVDGPVTLSA